MTESITSGHLSLVRRRQLEEIAATAIAQPYQIQPIEPISLGCPIIPGIKIDPTQRPKLISPENYSKEAEKTPHQKLIDLAKMLYQLEAKGLLRKEELFIQVKEYMKITEQEHAQISKSQNTNSTFRWFTDKISALLESFGLIAAGVFSIVATGNIPIGVAATIFGGLLLVETLFDNVMKKQVAALLQKMTHEKEEAWVYRLQLVCSAIVLGLGFAATPSYAFELAKNVSAAALTSVRTGLDWKQEGYLQKKLHADNNLQDSQKFVKLLTDVLSKGSKNQASLAQAAYEVAKNQRQTAQMLQV